MWARTPPTALQQAYLNQALASEAREVAKAEQGTRNGRLYKAAFSLGRYVAEAGLDEERVAAALEAAAEQCGLATDDGYRSVCATIRSGLMSGQRHPKAVPPKGG